MQERLNHRRAQFLTKSIDKLIEIESLLDALEERPDDRRSLELLNRHFHKFAGAGGIYELTRLCDLAVRAEDISSAALHSEVELPACDREKLRGICLEIIESIESEMKKPVPEC